MTAVYYQLMLFLKQTANNPMFYIIKHDTSLNVTACTIGLGILSKIDSMLKERLISIVFGRPFIFAFRLIQWCELITLVMLEGKSNHLATILF